MTPERALEWIAEHPETAAAGEVLAERITRLEAALHRATFDIHDRRAETLLTGRQA